MTTVDTNNLEPQELPRPDAPGVSHTKQGPPKPKKGSQFVFLRNSKAITGMIILGFFVIIAIIGPWIAPYDPDAFSDQLVAPPSWEHWLGTTHLGQDVLSQLLVGTRYVMIVGFTAGVLATILAVIVGVTAGYLGGWSDEGLSLLSNIFLVIPALPLLIIIASSLDGGMIVIAGVISLTAWAWGARVLRAQTMSHRKRDYVEASRANGESTWRIVLAEILPNLTAIIASSFVATVTFAILTQVTLAFIGVTSPTDWNWGTILYWAQGNQALARGAWWWFVPAGLCIAAVGVALALINFGIDEFVNPRLRSTGRYARVLRKRGVQARVGFTPIDRGTTHGGVAATPQPGSPPGGNSFAPEPSGEIPASTNVKG
ncbi:ABC transporter permease [Demequina aurantiaca]|uniref:ABC transporter permease n=1 Tax=Demequina aurantiaca TaxID=676200 RepID=UPI000A025CCE|nr:ABC transporter permease [Demequina aurantiaca]